jgi:hypothetical protein
MQLQPFRMKVRKSVRWSINSISTHGVTISLLVTIVSDPQGRFCMDAIRRDFIPQGSRVAMPEPKGYAIDSTKYVWVNNGQHMNYLGFTWNYL